MADAGGSAFTREYARSSEAIPATTFTGLGKLSEAHLGKVAKRSESERLESAARSAAEQRADLFRGASALLDGLYSELSVGGSPERQERPGKGTGSPSHLVRRS